MKFPFHTPLSGIVSLANGNYSGAIYGVFWTNDTYNNAGAYTLGFGTSYIHPKYSDYKRHGMTVRCATKQASLDPILFREAYHFIESGEMARSVSGSGTIMNSFPFTLPYSGQVERNGGTISTQGLSNLEWTNYTNASDSAIDLWIKDEFIKTRDVSSKNYGWTVRSRLYSLPRSLSFY